MSRKLILLFDVYLVYLLHIIYLIWIIYLPIHLVDGILVLFWIYLDFEWFINWFDLIFVYFIWFDAELDLLIYLIELLNCDL